MLDMSYGEQAGIQRLSQIKCGLFRAFSRTINTLVCTTIARHVSQQNHSVVATFVRNVRSRVRTNPTSRDRQ